MKHVWLLDSLKLTAKAPKIGPEKERMVFQPSLSRCKLLVFGKVLSTNQSCIFLLPHPFFFRKPRTIFVKKFRSFSGNWMFFTHKLNSSQRFRFIHQVVVSIIFYFEPYLGRWSNLTNSFQMGWNHQPDSQSSTRQKMVVSIFKSLKTLLSNGRPPLSWMIGVELCFMIHGSYRRGSMYSIFTYIYHTNQPNVGEYTIHGSMNIHEQLLVFRNAEFLRYQKCWILHLMSTHRLRWWWSRDSCRKDYEALFGSVWEDHSDFLSL